MMNKFHTSLSKRFKYAIAIVFISIVWYSCQTPASSDDNRMKNPVLNFPTTLSATFPYDVDEKVKKGFEAEKKFDQVQRLFEVLSWQTFVGLNWPYVDGKAQPSIISNGQPLWDSWEESFEVFREDGSQPTPWGQDYNLPELLKDKVSAADCSKVLYRTNKLAHKNHMDFADEIDQAFSTSIWDQNGNMVRYEVRMNELEFDYILKNELYNYDGQIAFAKNNDSPLVDFPSSTRTKEGAMEIKLAWKIIEEGDELAGRYFTKEACVMNSDGSFTASTVGLIGMHIAMKTKTSPQWIWATFEHVDNLETNPLETYNGKKITPSFYDPDCALCPVNVDPRPSNTKFQSYTAKDGVVSTDSFISSNYSPSNRKDTVSQIKRTIPISMATQALNQQAQTVLKEANSPLQYYQLVGTQWPTQPDVASYPVYSPKDNRVRTLPEAVTNKSGGMPTPVYLTNMVMETYFQGASSDVYNYMIANGPAYTQVEGFPANTAESGTRIFATESCTGCHSSSSIAIGDSINTKTNKRVPIFAERQNVDSKVIGDFSWLLQTKAHFKKK